MNTALPCHFSRPDFTFWGNLVPLLVTLVTAFTVGCGGGTVSQSSGSTLSGNTTVTVLISSTANDQLAQFALTFDSITLTNGKGNEITLFAAPQITEFMHLNGTVEPLITVSVPQGIYTSAKASIGYSQFACETIDPTNGYFSDNYYAQPSSPNVYLNLPEPFTISGTAMSLSLNLMVSESAKWTTCEANGLEPFSITPTFNLATVAIASQPTNSANGKATNLQGLIASVDDGGAVFSVAHDFISTGTGLSVAGDGSLWQVTPNGSTVYQGINGSSQLTVGMPLDMDAIIQEDGSLLATRIAVYDTNPANLTVRSGPLMNTNEDWPGQSGLALAAFGFESQGILELAGGGPFFYFENAVFQTSGQLTNMQSLPFPASFTASNMVAGQNVYISTHAPSATTGYIPATTITLLPQTINGAVGAVTTIGSFTTYTVTLAEYDLFPTMAAQDNQTSILTNPGSVVVYVDSNTQRLNTIPIAVGSVVRFNGLVFNDNGTLRMDCAQVNDGVTE